MPTTAVPVLLLLAFLSTATGSHHRHLLHQPFFPVTEPPTQPTSHSPSPSPQSQTHKSQPKYPFSTTPSTQQKPFFPSYSSTPPPPSPAILNTFPANISTILFPHRQNSSTHRQLIITITVSLSLFFAAVLAAISAFVIYFRHPHHGNTKKPPGSDSLRLFPPDTAPSDATQKTHYSNDQRRTPNTSTELLYLGTLVNPRATSNEIASNSTDIKIGVTSSPPYQRLGSPELKPLPPLPRLNYLHSSFNSAEVEGDSETEEEFFSPRGSSGRKETLNLSPIRHVSASRTEDQVLQGESSKFGSRSFNSRTASCPYSNPYSSSNSVSTNPSPASNVSPGSQNLRPPDSVIDFPDPRQAVNLSPTSMSSSSSLPSGIDFGIAQVSQEINRPASTREPPPPPPLPPLRFWEVPVGTRQPEFVTPPRHVVFQNVTTPGLANEQLQAVTENVGSKSEETTPKLKLKPLHWDKVRASSDRVMVWDQIKSSSFKLNEEMIETLFVVNNTGSGLGSKEGNLRRQVLPIQNQENRVLDPKKSQNIAILLRALNVTIDEVCEGLLEGNSDTIGTELLESLLKMAPTKEEERKLKEYKDDSPSKLGPAEKFLREVVNIPFAFKRVEAILYIANFDSEVEYLRRSFETLQRACAELRNSKMFLKLLEAVLKTGNRMNVGTNRGDAHAFKLDTLLKLVDIKGTDGKTTLLHFVVQEIIRIEGYRISGANSNQTAEKTQQSAFQDDVEFKKLGLEVVSGLSGELTNVKKAATMDSDVLSSEVEKLASGISKITEVVKLNEEIVLKEQSRKFSDSMTGFLKRAEEEILKIQAHKREALALVKEITECFHGNLAKEEAHQFRIFMVVRDFLSILDQVCKEVGKINERSVYSSFRPIPVTSILPPIFPGISGKQQHGSSDDESSSSF